MTLNRFAAPALALLLGTAGLSTARAYGLPQGPPPPGYGQERGGWDEPPQEFQEVQRHGFKDGIEAARDDYSHQRRPDVNRHDTYRNPQVSHEDRRAFREAFRRGYERAMSHLMGTPERN